MINREHKDRLFKMIFGREEHRDWTLSLYNAVNGTIDDEEERILKLSDAFPEDKREQSDVELNVHLINVNQGHNRKLMEDCRPMYEYSWLIDRIRENCKNMGIEAASLKAIEEMPEDFRIKDFLLKNKEEVQMSMLRNTTKRKPGVLLRRKNGKQV